MRDIIDELKVLSDKNRLRILSLLWEAEDLCGCEMEKILQMKQSNISRQLYRLRIAGFLSSYKSEQWVHYVISQLHLSEDSLLFRVITLVRESESIFSLDIERLQNYLRSEYTCKTIHQWMPFTEPSPEVRGRNNRSIQSEG